MRTLEDQLSNYAGYHRDRRNIATHFFGIPMIVLGILALLARPGLAVGAVSLSPALVVVVLGSLFYFLLDLRFGAVMLALNTPALLFGGWLASQSLSHWLVGAGGLFVLGWAIQFVGHVFEGKKPAFVDDLVGLLVGPLFVVAEVAFFLGMRRELHDAIEAKAGPTHGGRKEQRASATA
jgi:uncharacterized membrane protein YGL010W